MHQRCTIFLFLFLACSLAATSVRAQSAPGLDPIPDALVEKAPEAEKPTDTVATPPSEKPPAAKKAASKKPYQRMMFYFDKPARLTANNGSQTLVLSFDQPIKESAETIRANLTGYAKSAALSADGRSVTIQLNKAYRIRQFMSGNSVGVDVVGMPEDAAPPPVEKTPPPAKTEPTKKPVPAAAKPAAQPAAKETKPARTTEKKSPAASSPPPPESNVLSTKRQGEAAPTTQKPADASILTTKKTADAPATKKPDNVAEVKKTDPAKQPIEKIIPPAQAAPAAAAERSIYTTKPNLAVAPPANVAETDVPASAPAPIMTTKHPEKPAVAAPAKTVATAVAAKESPAVQPAVATPAAEKKAPATDKKLPFIVSAKNSATGSEVNFPWGERTAVAVFERGNDIWLVFSRPANANVKLLRSVLPAAVVSINQYAYAGNTVLRFSTDGTLHPTLTQTTDGYGWNLLLSTAKAPAKLEITVGAEGEDAERHLLLSAFDVAPALRFYDPRVGDLLIVVPAYESGRGMVVEKRYPELTLLPTQQGIVISSTLDDLTIDNSRIGMSVGAPEGLLISENLPVQTNGTSGGVPLAGISTSGVMLPYRQWQVSPNQFKIIESQRLQAASSASKDTKPETLMSLVALYLGQGMGTEAHGYLTIIEQNFPEFFKDRKMALLDAAALFLMNRPDEAMGRLGAQELADLPEAALWREAMAQYAPRASVVQQAQEQLDQHIKTTQEAVSTGGASTVATGVAATAIPNTPMVSNAPVFHFLKYDKQFIRYYPPVIRQRLAIAAADSYIATDQEEKALAVYDTLSRDDILKPVQAYAEFALGAVASKKKKSDEALEIFDRLGTDSTQRYIQARARYAAAMLRYTKGLTEAYPTTEEIENIRSSWRGDALERDMLMSLATIYKDSKQYDSALRSYKTLLDNFPGDPDYLTISGNMSALFEDLYVNGMADQMPPLRALSLFYEFRDLTPLGEKGDIMVGHLADRLAALDLLDRATQLLDHQVKSRLGGEQRSRIGARLALLYLFNQQPKDALDALEASNFGENNAELKIQRQQLAAEAMKRLERYEEALALLFNDTTKQGALLRLDILWAMQDWPNVVNRAEDILAARTNLTAPLATQETEVLLKLALAYSFSNDNTQLRYLRDYYAGLIPDTAYKQIFDFVTNDTAPLDPEDVNAISKQISNTQSFLNTFKEKIAAGKLSEAIK